MSVARSPRKSGVEKRNKAVYLENLRTPNLRTYNCLRVNSSTDFSDYAYVKLRVLRVLRVSRANLRVSDMLSAALDGAVGPLGPLLPDAVRGLSVQEDARDDVAALHLGLLIWTCHDSTYFQPVRLPP